MEAGKGKKRKILGSPAEGVRRYSINRSSQRRLHSGVIVPCHAPTLVGMLSENAQGALWYRSCACGAVFHELRARFRRWRPHVSRT